MWILIISSFLALLSGITTQLTDLYHFTNDAEKENFKNKIKFWSFGIFIITICFSTYQLLHNYSKSEQDRNKADIILHSTKKLDSIKSDSLFRDNKDLKDSLKHVNMVLRNLENSNSRLLLSQTENFIKTARKIQNSADTLNKYISGSEGYCYLILTSINRGDYFFSINNPYKYSLRNVRIFTNKYSNLDSCVEWRSGTRFLNMDKLIKKSILTANVEALAPGLLTENIQVYLKDGWKQKFLIRIEVGNKIYFEDLIISTADGCIGFKVYSYDLKEKIVVYKQYVDPCLFKFDWNTEFHFNLLGLMEKRGMD